MKISVGQPYFVEDRYFVEVDGTKVATFYVDYLKQLDQVVLHPGISEKVKLEVLRRAVSHTHRYVVDRTLYDRGRLKIAIERQRSSSIKSYEVMTDSDIPSYIKKMRMEELEQALEEARITVIMAEVRSLVEAINVALTDERFTVPVSFSIRGEVGYETLARVSFNVAPPISFKGWHRVGKPGEGFDLYIIPSYHPDLNDEMTSVGLINGDTDAYIAGNAVRSIYAPHLLAYRPGRTLSGSWSKVNHPFYVEGNEVEMDISMTRALSPEGIEEIRSVLLALLELDNKYLSISGGFRSPLPYPSNVAHRYGIRTSSWDGEARGSEGYDVWAYSILKGEGELANAYIPAWFIKERWLPAYGVEA